jgi:hypothetical protein
MSLASALMAAINGSTGSCATLSHGLERPHQASPASSGRRQEFSALMGGGARGRHANATARDAAGYVRMGQGPEVAMRALIVILDWRFPADQNCCAERSSSLLDDVVALACGAPGRFSGCG